MAWVASIWGEFNTFSLHIDEMLQELNHLELLYLQSNEDVSQGLAVRVVAVHRQGTNRHLLDHRLQHLNHAPRCAYTNGVAQRDLIATHGVQTLGYLSY